MLGVIAKLVGLLAGGWIAKEALSGGGGGPPIKQGVFGVYTPTDVEPGTVVTELDASEEIGKSGGTQAETFDYQLRTMSKGETLDVVVDLALTAYIAATNRFYVNGAGHQFCNGVRIRATATRTATGVKLSNVEQEPNAEACAVIVGEGVDPSLQVPWPSKDYPTTKPVVELIAKADGFALRITAPSLKFSTETAMPGQGYGPGFWSKVGPYRYTLRLVGSMQTKAVAAS